MSGDKKYDEAFKVEVAKMVVDQGLSVKNVSQQMNVGCTALRRWVSQYKGELVGQAVIGRALSAEQQRIRQLEQENRRLRSDNDLLKKVSAFFARELK
jgi:transposase